MYNNNRPLNKTSTNTEHKVIRKQRRNTRFTYLRTLGHDYGYNIVINTRADVS